MLHLIQLTYLSISKYDVFCHNLIKGLALFKKIFFRFRIVTETRGINIDALPIHNKNRLIIAKQ